MPRGGNNNFRGRGFRGGPRGGRGGGGPPRGGRGGRGGGGGRGRGRGRGGGLGYLDSVYDFPVQMWPEENARSGYNTPPRGRGRGGSGPSSYPNSGTGTPRGRGRGDGGYDSPRGGRGGRGRGGPRSGPNAPLSKLLYEERPLLKPVIFVRSVHTATLFEKQEDILQAIVEDVVDTEESHIPTAERVARVFSGGGKPPQRESSSNSDDDASDREHLEEIDFNDMGRLAQEVNAMAAAQTTTNAGQVTHIEEKFTGFFVDTTPTPISDAPAGPSRREGAGVEQHTPLGEEEEPEEIIVYVAPHPRPGRKPSVPPPPPAVSAHIPDVSRPAGLAPSDHRVETPETVSTVSSVTESNYASSTTAAHIPEAAPIPEVDMEVAEDDQPMRTPEPPVPAEASGSRYDRAPLEPTPPPAIPPAPPISSVTFNFASPSPAKQPRHAPVFSVGGKAKAKAKARKKDARAARRRQERHAMFGSFGAILSEAQLHDGEGVNGRDPRLEERRRGDSDVDWGDEDEEEGEDAVEELSSGLGAMDIDQDVGQDLGAMEAFVKGLSAEGSRHVTMDDFEDDDASGESLYESTESGMGEGGDGDGDVLVVEEQTMRAEAVEDSGSDDEDYDSDEDEETPRTSFQARLERLRSASRKKGKQPAGPLDGPEDTDSDDGGMEFQSWADQDDDFFAQIENILDENDAMLNGRDRKQRNKLFRAVRDGAFSDDELEFEFPMAKSKKNKAKDLPDHLRAQWDKDRARKAEYKRARENARLLAAADPLTPKKGGKKGRKATRAAAALDATVDVPPRVADMASLEAQIRRFLLARDRPQMPLPPMDKDTRADVHALALAFGLKSQSKGKGTDRYITLIRKRESGRNVNEGKVRRILRDAGVFVGPGRAKGGVAVPRHKEGEEVGKAAPKLNDTNVGFRMLAMMGWAEGDRIGVKGGLEAPLTAVIKNTKAGLGATK